MDFEHWCFACGKLNPAGLHLDLIVGTDRAEARFTGEQRHQGYDGAVHGGIVTALLDEVMGWSIFQQGIWAVTAKLEISFRRPVPVGAPLLVTGAITRDRSRALETHGEIRSETSGDLLAEATATFLRMPEERQAELEGRYARTTETFARVRAAVAAEAAAQGSRK